MNVLITDLYCLQRQGDLLISIVMFKKKKKTFPLAEIGDGGNRFYLKMYSKCSLLALLVWIHQDVVNTLSNKGVSLGQDFCRIQLLRKFLTVLAV